MPAWMIFLHSTEVLSTLQENELSNLEQIEIQTPKIWCHEGDGFMYPMQQGERLAQF